MFHVELAPLGGILGPLKSDLGVFRAKIPLYPYNVKTQKRIFSKPFHGRILISWNLILFCTKIKKFTMDNFFSLDACSGPMCVSVYLLKWAKPGLSNLCVLEHLLQMLDLVFKVVLKAEFSSRCLLRVVSRPFLLSSST